MPDAARLKALVGEAAAEMVADGMTLGIGTGSTAEAFIRALARRVNGGLDICGVATSSRTEILCRELGIPVTTLESVPQLDLTIDGADEFDSHLTLIKGGGGALLKEKIVAAASGRMIVIADASKKVSTLGAFPLPIEINGFGMMATYLAVRDAAKAMGLEGEIVLRKRNGGPFITDSGHLLLDASFGHIPNPEALSTVLLAIPGVVEHGLFIGLASTVLMASESGVETLSA